MPSNLYMRTILFLIGFIRMCIIFPIMYPTYNGVQPFGIIFSVKGAGAMHSENAYEEGGKSKLLVGRIKKRGSFMMSYAWHEYLSNPSQDCVGL